MFLIIQALTIFWRSINFNILIFRIRIKNILEFSEFSELELEIFSSSVNILVFFCLLFSFYYKLRPI